MALVLGELIGLTRDHLDEVIERGRLRNSLPPPATRRLIRVRAGLTQDDLAAMFDRSGACISRWESGRRHPRGADLLAYAALLERLTREVLRNGGGT